MNQSRLSRNVHLLRSIAMGKIVHCVSHRSKAWWGTNILCHNMMMIWHSYHRFQRLIYLAFLSCLYSLLSTLDLASNALSSFNSYHWFNMGTGKSTGGNGQRRNDFFWYFENDMQCMLMKCECKIFFLYFDMQRKCNAGIVWTWDNMSITKQPI